MKKPKQNPQNKDLTITKEMLIAEVVEKCPDCIEVFLDYGLHCVGCALAASESIEDGAKAHGLEESEIAHLVERINEVMLYND